jgi:hypothetical protein
VVSGLARGQLCAKSSCIAASHLLKDTPTRCLSLVQGELQIRASFAAMSDGLIRFTWVAAAALGWLLVYNPPPDSAAVAAWVQAFGSIGAVVAVGWATNKAHEKERQLATDLKLQEWCGLLSSAIQLIGAVRGTAERVLDVATDPQKQSLHTLEMLALQMETCANALAKVDHLRFDTFKVIEPLIAAESCAKTMLNTLQIERKRFHSPVGVQWAQLGADAQALMNQLDARVPILLEFACKQGCQKRWPTE